jgi:hypothetical protein
MMNVEGLELAEGRCVGWIRPWGHVARGDRLVLGIRLAYGDLDYCSKRGLIIDIAFLYWGLWFGLVRKMEYR